MVIKTSQLMMHKAKVAVCSDVRTKHSTQREHHVEIVNIKSGGT
jgi:rhodanese-related sulfurtransferase